MRRRVELRDDPDAALARRRDDAGDVVSGVDQSPVERSAFCGELGSPGKRDREGLVVREVPVEHVHLRRLHGVQMGKDDVQR